MATVVGVTLVKRINYRGDATEEFSNQYWLSGGVPADATAWKALADALIAQEKTVYPSGVTVVRAYGYNDNSPTAASVWSYDYLSHTATVAGTLAVGTGVANPGDCAVWVRWRTSRNNSKGKPIYLRKYIHPAVSSAGTPDVVLPAQRTALLALGNKLYDGTFLDARTIRSASSSETITAADTSPYVTTHTLKRRGKRPS